MISRLYELLDISKNGGKLSDDSLEEAFDLIKSPIYSGKNCLVCKVKKGNAIYDIKFCQEHALDIIYD